MGRGEGNDKFSGEIVGRRGRADDGDKVTDFKIFDFRVFDGPGFLFRIFQSKGGGGGIGDAAGDDESFIRSGFGNYQEAFDGQCALTIHIAHGNDKIAHFQISKSAFFACDKFDSSVAGDYGSPGLIAKIGNSNRRFGFGGNGTDVGFSGDSSFDGGDLVFDGLTDSAIGSRGRLSQKCGRKKKCEYHILAVE